MATAPTFEIERGVPTPDHARRKYPFADMEVGDSFFVPGATPVRLTNAANSLKQCYGWKRSFSARKVDGGARIWRVA
jgi:hypothetical protein